jgi:ABC-2 type transport system permease protein
MVNNLIRHIKLYLKFAKFSMMIETEYRWSFFLEIMVELAFFTATLTGLAVLLSNVTTLAGWTRAELYVLYGVNMIFSELLLGTSFINSLRDLPDKIRRGDIDLVLVKPMNSLFAVSLTRPYFASLPSLLSGVFVASYGFYTGHLSFSPISLLSFLLLLGMGLIIGYSLGVIISSLTFWIAGATPLPRIAEQVTFQSKHPFDIYSGVWRTVFFWVIPTGLMVSFPSSALLGKSSGIVMLQSFVVAIVFLSLARLVWKRGLKVYDSASS